MSDNNRTETKRYRGEGGRRDVLRSETEGPTNLSRSVSYPKGKKSRRSRGDHEGRERYDEWR